MNKQFEFQFQIICTCFTSVQPHTRFRVSTGELRPTNRAFWTRPIQRAGSPPLNWSYSYYAADRVTRPNLQENHGSAKPARVYQACEKGVHKEFFSSLLFAEQAVEIRVFFSVAVLADGSYVGE